MTAREVKLWEMACGALTVAVFAADALAFWWLEAWDYPASDHKREMLFQVGLGRLRIPAWHLSAVMGRVRPQTGPRQHALAVGPGPCADAQC